MICARHGSERGGSIYRQAAELDLLASQKIWISEQLCGVWESDPNLRVLLASPRSVDFLRPSGRLGVMDHLPFSCCSVPWY